MRNLFITATGQNIGKTAFTAGILAVLREELGDEVGYMKPIGQRYVEQDGEKIDEDVLLMNSIYDFSEELKDMSPVIIDSGFTRANLGGKHADKLAKRIEDAYSRVKKNKKMVVFEGSGKSSVGEVFGLSNMRIARMLDADVVLICGGGIGSTIDSCALNRAFIEAHDANFLGVVINKVFKKKYEEINQITRSGLEGMGYPVLGVIPYEPLLSEPTLKIILDNLDDIELLTSSKGDIDRRVTKIIVGAMTPHQALKYFEGGELLITGGDREDILVATLCRTAMAMGRDEDSFVSAIIATGGLKPHPSILETAERLNTLICLAQEDTFTTASRIKDLTVKIQPGDRDKIRSLQELIRKHISLDTILTRG